MERFIKEYARHKIKWFNGLKREYPENMAIYDKAIDTIEKSLKFRDQGLITVDETIAIILDSTK